MDIGIKVWTVSKTERIRCKPATEDWGIIALAEIGEAGFGIVAFAGKAPGVDWD